MSGLALISKQRLDTYLRFASDEARAMELHNLTLQVGLSLMASIALIELAVRNITDGLIAREFGADDWMQAPPPELTLADNERKLIRQAIQHAQKAQYSKLTYKGKKALDEKIFPLGVPVGISHDKLSRKRWETFKVSQGQVIAQTTIYFWKRLYSSDYEGLLWKRALRKAFPQKHIRRVDVAEHLEALYSARNRVAHHDPVYGERLDRAFESVVFFREHFGRRASDTRTDFQEFTEVQFHRLYIDFISFKRSWDLLSY